MGEKKEGRKKWEGGFSWHWEQDRAKKTIRVGSIDTMIWVRWGGWDKASWYPICVKVADFASTLLYSWISLLIFNEVWVVTMTRSVLFSQPQVVVHTSRFIAWRLQHCASLHVWMYLQISITPHRTSISPSIYLNTILFLLKHIHFSIITVIAVKVCAAVGK